VTEEPRKDVDIDGLSTPRPDPAPGRWCLLRHDLPDGTWHLDLMIAAEPPSTASDAARPLVTLRLPARTSPAPNDPDCQGFVAERIGNHRAVYLEYEGPVSGGRGSVVRLASGSGGAALVSEGGAAGFVEIGLEGVRFRAVGSWRGGLLRFDRVS